MSDVGGFRISQSCFVLFYCESDAEAESDLLQVFRRSGVSGDVLDAVRDRIRITDFDVTTSSLPEFNVYSSVLLGAACQAQSIPLTTNTKLQQVSRAVQDSLDFREGQGIRWISNDGTPWGSSGFLTYWALRAIDETPDNHQQRERTLNWLEGEMYRQVVLFESGQSEISDVMQLGYCVASCLRFNRSLPRATMARVWSAIFRHQSDNGIWLRGDPIVPIPEIGTVYSFAPEMLAVLLGECVRYWDQLEVHYEAILRLCDWLEGNYRAGPPSGWRSNHVPPGPAECWSTSAVAWLLANLQKVIGSWLTEKARREFERELRDRDALSEIWDSPVYLTDGSKESLKSLVTTHIIDPAKGTRPDTRSALLYGPPGTAKTSYARAIAYELNWPFLEITVGDFLTHGSESVAQRAREIFDLLEFCERVVVLFDEIEELVRRRNHPEAERESRLLTTALLPYFQDLRDARRSIFLATTNRIEVIDDAAIRLGRFDVVLPVAPPDFEEKEKHLLNNLPSAVNQVEIRRVLNRKKYKTGIDWATYQEWRGFTRRISDISATEEFESALKSAVEHLAIGREDQKRFAEREFRLP